MPAGTVTPATSDQLGRLPTDRDVTPLRRMFFTSLAKNRPIKNGPESSGPCIDWAFTLFDFGLFGRSHLFLAPQAQQAKASQAGKPQ